MQVTSTIDDLLAPQNTEDTQTKSNDFMGKEDFLMLLITQMKYQNPLDPVSNEEFAAQLAQFSSLEQLTNLNTTMENSAESDIALTSSISNSLAASLIGKHVLAENNQFYHTDGQSDVLGFSLNDNAKSVTVRVKTQVGTVIYEENLGPKGKGSNSFVWDGKDADGNVIADGLFKFEVEAYGMDDSDVLDSTLTTGLITGVRYHDGGAFLVVDNVEIPMSEVKEVLMPNTEE